MGRVHEKRQRGGGSEQESTDGGTDELLTDRHSCLQRAVGRILARLEEGAAELAA